MKIDDIPNEANYLSLIDGITFKPITDDVFEKKDGDGNVVGHDINVLCLDDNIVYKLTLAQTRNKKKMFELVKKSIKGGFLPIQVVVERVGSGDKFYNNYNKSFIVDNHKPEVTIESPKEEVAVDRVEEIFKKFCKKCKNDYEMSTTFRSFLGKWKEFTEAVLALSEEEQIMLNDRVSKLNNHSINTVKYFIEKHNKEQGASNG